MGISSFLSANVGISIGKTLIRKNKSDLKNGLPVSIGFDIDVEIATNLVSENNTIKEIPISYKRRSQTEGKKLKLTDGWKILKRILFTSL